MKAGEYSSVRAAALEAGIVRRRLQIPAEPEAAGVYLAKKFSREEWERLVESGRSFYGEDRAVSGIPERSEAESAPDFVGATAEKSDGTLGATHGKARPEGGVGRPRA